jgi:hypothetical protein
MKTEKSDFILLKFLLAGLICMLSWHLTWVALFAISRFQLNIEIQTISDGVIFTVACIGYGACRDFGND